MHIRATCPQEGVNFLQKPLLSRGREWGSPLKGRQGRRTWASELLVWERYERRSNIGEARGGTDARGGHPRKRCARERAYAHAHVCTRLKEFTQRVHTHIAHGIREHTPATCVAHESAWKKEGCGQEDDGRESRWRRSLARPSSILHKVRWEISINRFRLSIGADRRRAFGLRAAATVRSVRNAAKKRAVL